MLFYLEMALKVLPHNLLEERLEMVGRPAPAPIRQGGSSGRRLKSKWGCTRVILFTGPC